MKRIWQIEEQVVEDPTTKLRLEFSSVHSDELAQDREPPGHDDVVVLRLWTSDRTKQVTFLFERNGRFIRSEINNLEHVQPLTVAQAANAVDLGTGIG